MTRLHDLLVIPNTTKRTSSQMTRVCDLLVIPNHHKDKH